MILFISSQAPFEKQQDKELLDMALAAGAFDLDCAFLLEGDAVLQIKEHNSQLIEQKDINKSLKALPLYDLEPVFVFEQDLEKFNLTKDSTSLDLSIIKKQEQSEFIKKASKVIRL